MYNIKYGIFTALLIITFWYIPSFLHVGIFGIVFKGLAIIMGILLIISTIAGVLDDIKDKFRR